MSSSNGPLPDKILTQIYKRRSHLHKIHLSIWERYFMWHSKAYLWNSTQDIYTDKDMSDTLTMTYWITITPKRHSVSALQTQNVNLIYKKVQDSKLSIWVTSTLYNLLSWPQRLLFWLDWWQGSRPLQPWIIPACLCQSGDHNGNISGLTQRGHPSTWACHDAITGKRFPHCWHTATGGLQRAIMKNFDV